MGQGEKKILISVDGSEHSFEAVRYVAQMLPAGRAKVTLFHVISRLPDSLLDVKKTSGIGYKFVGSQAWEQHQEKKIGDFMERASRILKTAGYSTDSISVVVRQRKGGIARDIGREAQKGYDALVLGRRGVSRFKDFIIGSVANKLIDHLQNVPLWVVGGHPDTKKILVAMDGSEGAMAAAEYVGNVLGDACPELLLLNVVRGLLALELSYEELSFEERDLIKLTKEELEKAKVEMESVFEDATKKLEQKGVDIRRIKTKFVSEAISRAGSIVEEADKGGYDTIVVGRRGLSKVEAFFMGRVSSKVMQLAKEKALWIVG